MYYYPDFLFYPKIEKWQSDKLQCAPILNSTNQSGYAQKKVVSLIIRPPDRAPMGLRLSEPRRGSAFLTRRMDMDVIWR